VRALTRKIDDVRIVELKELAPPRAVLEELPSDDAVAELVAGTRDAAHAIIHGTDDRLLVVVGPCSIHDPVAALEYARLLAPERRRHAPDLEVVMRVYFEKPRTTVGWKGLINDPALDDSYDINAGLRAARSVLLDVAREGVPAGCEFLDTITPQYIADLVAWGAIGARTTESQVHRELASGLSCPVGFKNGTDGNIRIAIDAIAAANHAHHFLSVTKDGRSAIVSTTGNEDAHVILRGGREPNYDEGSVAEVAGELARAEMAVGIMIDASHGNSRKQHRNQFPVCRDVARQVAEGDAPIAGIMIESHLVEGRQDRVPGVPLVYGRSITDGCVGWPETTEMLDVLAAAVRDRRARRMAR